MKNRDLRNTSGRRRLAAGLAMLAVFGCVLAWSPVPVGAAITAEPAGQGTAIEEGVISWYGKSFHASPTASGELFDAEAMTMAHPSLPFGTQVRVTNLRNGRSVVVRVNDRGPFVGRRVGDVSAAAASALGMLRRGVVKARLEVLDPTGEFAG